MTEYLIREETLVDIADEVRELSGISDNLSPDDIKNNLNTINSDMKTQSNLIGQIKTLIDEKTDLHLPTLTNEGTATDLLLGKELINSKGEAVVGTIPTITKENVLVNGPTFIIPSGYYAEQVEKSVKVAEIPTPSITVDASGLVTTTAVQSEGYVFSGTTSSTYQLAFQPAKTITPNLTSQIAVASGYFTGGDVIVDAVSTQSKNITPTSVAQIITPDTGKFFSQVIVDGDPNLKPEIIKKGINIFNVTGTFRGNNTSVISSENEELIIERTISGYYSNSRVSTIRRAAFVNCANLTSVNFPNVTTIGDRAFHSCTGLTTASFPKATNIQSSAFTRCTSLTSINSPKVTTIGVYAFMSCANLTSVNFPNVTTIDSSAFTSTNLTTADFSKITLINAGTFNSCTNLTSVNIPNATSIGKFAFVDCISLTSINFPKVTSISTRAFASCTSLTSISFPNVTTIGADAFIRCSSLTSVSFPNVTTIGDGAFSDCTGLTSVNFPNITRVESNTFNGCTGLTSVSLPNISFIGSNAFARCVGLTKLSFPKVTEIQKQAFYNCTNLTKLSFPKVTEIEKQAFYNCTNLSTIYITTNQVCSLDRSDAFTGTGIGPSIGSIFVPASLVNSYQKASYWSYFSNIIFGV